MPEPALTLHEAEADRIAQCKRRDEESLGIRQRTPDPLVRARVDRQAVRVMDLWSVVVATRPLVGAEEEHARQRRQTELAAALAHEEPRVDVERRRDAGLQNEPVRAGDARRVEHRVDRELLRRRRWTLEPELHETRELLAAALRGVDGERAGGQAVALPSAERAEIAGAQEHEHFVAIRRRVEREVHPKAGKPRAAQLVPRERVSTIVERVGIERNLARAIAADLVDRDRILVEPAAMKEHDLERQLGVVPQRTLGSIADVAVLIVAERLDGLGKPGARLLVGRRGQLFRAHRDVVEAERTRLGAAQHRGDDQRDQAEKRAGARHTSTKSIRELFTTQYPAATHRPERLRGICAVADATCDAASY